MVDSSPGLVLKELARAAFKKWHVFNRTSHTEELVLPLHGANTGVAAGETMRLRNQGEGSPPPPPVHSTYTLRDESHARHTFQAFGRSGNQGLHLCFHSVKLKQTTCQKFHRGSLVSSMLTFKSNSGLPQMEGSLRCLIRETKHSGAGVRGLILALLRASCMSETHFTCAPSSGTWG